MNRLFLVFPLLSACSASFSTADSVPEGGFTEEKQEASQVDSRSSGPLHPHPLTSGDSQSSKDAPRSLKEAGGSVSDSRTGLEAGSDAAVAKGLDAGSTDGPDNSPEAASDVTNDAGVDVAALSDANEPPEGSLADHKNCTSWSSTVWCYPPDHAFTGCPRAAIWAPYDDCDPGPGSGSWCCHKP